MSDPDRYRFPPMERRGLVAGIQAWQAVFVALGLVAAVALFSALPGVLGLIGAVAVAVGVLGVAFWNVAGRPLVAWLPVVAAYRVRRRAGAIIDPRPLDGSPGIAGGNPPVLRRVPTFERTERRAVPVRLRRRDGTEVEVVADPSAPAVGIVRDRRNSSCLAVLPVGARKFALLDPAGKHAELAAWGAVLAALGRPGSGVHRIQWVERATMAGPENLDAWPTPCLTRSAGPGADRAAESYTELLGSSTPLLRQHQVLVALAVVEHRTHRPRRFADEALSAEGLLHREIRLLQSRLRDSGLDVAAPLSAEQLQVALSPLTPGRLPSLVERPPSGPWRFSGATDEAWGEARREGTWHATYWIAEWPRLDVAPDFLVPLLLSGGTRAFGLTMAPVRADRAARDVEAARSDGLADEELRRRAGFMTTARRQRAAEGIMRREAELADGHADFRFSGYVTVSEQRRQDLEISCASFEQAARRAHLDLRRLYGRQSEGLTWTLPLARGLR
jgi:hypothetical protein